MFSFVEMEWRDPAMTESVKKLKEWVEESRKIVFFGGAGVSTESGEIGGIF